VRGKEANVSFFFFSSFLLHAKTKFVKTEMKCARTLCQYRLTLDQTEFSSICSKETYGALSPEVKFATLQGSRLFLSLRSKHKTLVLGYAIPVWA